MGSAAFKAVGTGDPRPAGSIPVHLRHDVSGRPPRVMESLLSWANAHRRSWTFRDVHGVQLSRLGPSAVAVGGVQPTEVPPCPVPRAPRGRRVHDPSDGSFVVVNRAPRGQPDPYFDTARNVWVARWRKADGRLGTSRPAEREPLSRRSIARR